MSIDLEKGHKHADLAIQYYTEAKEDAEAWRNWRYSLDNDIWVKCNGDPRFEKDRFYRRKPKVKLVHGFEVPDISFVPNRGDECYIPITHLPTMVSFLSTDDISDATKHHLSANNACYPHTEEGKQAAIKHALAMWGFGSMEEYKKAMDGTK